MAAAQRPGGGQAKICQFKLVLLGEVSLSSLSSLSALSAPVPGHRKNRFGSIGQAVADGQLGPSLFES